MKNLRAVVALAISLALVYAVGGCAMLQQGPSDEELLSELVRDWLAAMKDGNVEKLMSLYSKNYMDESGADYEMAKSRMEQIVPMIEQIEAEFSSVDAEIEIDGNSAIISPITVDSSFGSMDITLATAKEGGIWRITATEMEQ